MSVKQLTWPAVGLIAVIGAVVVALAALTQWDASAIIAVAGILAGLGGGAAVAGGVVGRVDDVHAETAAQTQTLKTIQRQTNGLSEIERQDIAERAAAAVLRQQKQGGR